jgi:hypothetical protein
MLLGGAMMLIVPEEQSPGSFMNRHYYYCYGCTLLHRLRSRDACQDEDPTY